MPAAIINFVDVSVIVAGGVADAFSFGVPMGVFEHTITSNRQDGPYFSISEVVAAGFTSVAAPEVNAWATAVFSQDDGVDQLLIGRRIAPAGEPALQVWQTTAIGPVFVDMTTEYNDATVANFLPFPAVEAVGDYVAFGSNETFGQLIMDNTGGTAGTVGVVAWEYWDGSAWQVIPGIVDGTTGFTAAVSAGQTVTWIPPLDWAQTTLNGVAAFYVRAVVSTIFTVDPIYDVGTLGGDLTWTTTMDAVNLAGSETWYLTNIESRVAADILEVAAWTEPRSKIYMAQTEDADLLAGTPGNIGLLLQAAGYLRTALWYHATSSGTDGYLDGAITSSGGGLNLDGPGGVGIWAYRQLEGVTFDAVTALEANNIYDADANLNGRIGLSFTSKGTMAAGAPRYIDITTSVDWVKKRCEEAGLSLFVSTPTKIPYTNGGINQMVGAMQGVLDSGVTFGHFSPDFPPTIKAPDVSQVSAADKQNRVLNLTAEATFAGAIQKLVFTINLEF